MAYRWQRLTGMAVRCGRMADPPSTAGAEESRCSLHGHANALVAAKVGLTYLVPFSVSTYSALAANRLT